MKSVFSSKENWRLAQNFSVYTFVYVCNTALNLRVKYRKLSETYRLAHDLPVVINDSNSFSMDFLKEAFSSERSRSSLNE